MIAIQNHATPSTNMCPNAERLVHDSVAIRTFLASIVRWHSNHRNGMQVCIALDPLEENSPSGIMDRFGKLAVADHVLNLKVFIGNQVVRADERVCHLSGQILTLPLDFQMLLGQLLAGFHTIGRFLLLAGKSPLESFESRLCFAIVPGIGDGISLGVGQETLEPDINPQLLPGWNMLDFALGINAELAVVAICTPNDTNTLDQLDREFLDALIGIANQFQASNPTAIREGDMTTMRIKLPTRGLVFYAPVVVLKLWVPLFSRL